MSKFIGLEFGSHAITFVYLQVIGKRRHLLKSGRVKLEPKEANLKNIASILRDLLTGVDLLDTRIISTVSHPHLFVREFIFPQMSKKELLEAARWKIRDYLIFPLEEAIVDVKITEKISEAQFKRLKLLVVAIPQDAVIQQINILRAAGIMPSVITIAPLAFEHLLKFSIALKKEESFMTLNIGPELTNVSIYKDSKLELTRMVTSKIDRLPLEMRLSLDYFIEESHGGSQVETVILFGEQAEFKELANILKQQLPLPIETINPLQDAAISYKPDSLRYKDGLISGQQIAISLGAALSYDKGINLLPEQAISQMGNYLLYAGARCVAILGSFIFLFIYLSFKFNVEGYKERVFAADAEVKTLMPLIREIEPLENLNKEVSNRFNLVKLLLRRRRVYSEILKEISQLLPESITLDGLTVSETGVTFRGTVSSTKLPPENILSNFIVSLEKGIFKDVSLTSAQN